jgi:uncharacterized protein (TIGR03437 family)
MRLRATLFFALALCGNGQTGPSVTGAGYTFPIAPAIAPGQIIRIQATGLKTVLSPSFQQATSIPLPAVLAGISVTVNQSIRQTAQGAATPVSYQAPLLSLNQVSLCPSTSTNVPGCLATFITAQMPYELEVGLPSPPFVDTEIVVSENGSAGNAFRVGAQMDRIHVVTTCEDQPTQTGCPPIVAHADGTLVSASSPGKPGEIIVIYAWGVGPTTPQVKTGEASPIPAAVVTIPGFASGLLVGFDFRPNGAPSRYFPEPVFAMAYLTPGFVGLYQVNVQLPATFPAVPACSAAIQSNLTVNLAGMSSFDGAAICVQGVG